MCQKHEDNQKIRSDAVKGGKEESKRSNLSIHAGGERFRETVAWFVQQATTDSMRMSRISVPWDDSAGRRFYYGDWISNVLNQGRGGGMMAVYRGNLVWLPFSKSVLLQGNMFFFFSFGLIYRHDLISSFSGVQ